MSPRTSKQYNEIRAEKREHIMDVSLKLFADHGYHVTSISNIANQAGISKGLLYNYFESKDALLSEIIDRLTKDIIRIANPNNDEEISNEEMTGFFSELIKNIKCNPEYWKLFFQMSLQKEVIESLNNNINNKIYLKNNILLRKYFEDRFDDPDLEFFTFTSLLKGFVLQYAFSDQYFSDKLVDRFKKKLVDLFIKPKRS